MAAITKASSMLLTCDPDNHDSATIRQKQLAKLPLSVAHVSKLFKPVKLPDAHSLLSEFVYWLIRNDNIHTNTNIDGLLGGNFISRWKLKKPSLATVASHTQVDERTISKHADGDDWARLYHVVRFHYVR